jgi:hypothetical protein
LHSATISSIVTSVGRVPCSVAMAGTVAAAIIPHRHAHL